MSETVTKSVSEVEMGDMLHFPNSRSAQQVTFLEKKEDGSVVFGTQRTRWTVGEGKQVRVEVPKSEDD